MAKGPKSIKGPRALSPSQGAGPTTAKVLRDPKASKKTPMVDAFVLTQKKGKPGC